MITKTMAEWKAEGEKLYGKGRDWKFKCPKCGHIQTGADFLAAGMEEEAVMSRVFCICIGRILKGVGCDWSLHGLFRIHEVEVVTEDGIRIPVFEFADQVPVQP